VRFEALEQTLRLHLVSGPVDKKFFFLMGNRLSRTVHQVVPRLRSPRFFKKLEIMLNRQHASLVTAVGPNSGDVIVITMSGA
jgi:hypothetical protein